MCLFVRAHGSVVERVPDKNEVLGSIPSAPTLSMEDIPHNDIRAEKEKSDAEARQLALLRGTYQLAQGNFQLNLPILDYLTRIGAFDPSALLTIPQDKVERYLTPPKYHTEVEQPTIQLDVAKTLKFVQELKGENDVNKEDGHSMLSLVDEIVRGVIEADLKYQRQRSFKDLVPGRRPNRPEERESSFDIDSHLDPHASMLRRYVINNQPLVAGRAVEDSVNTAFSTLFSDMRGVVDTINNTGWNTENYQYIAIKKNLDELQYHWEKHHPGEQFFPD